MNFFIYKLFFLFALFFTIPKIYNAQSVSTSERNVTKIAEGVYAIQHPDAPNGFPQGNTTVVIGKEKVLVVDACYFPSSAKEDLEQIQKWTDKPVAYLVNTHWHLDHNNGNYVYKDAFPEIKIISHPATKELIATKNKEGVISFLNKYETMKKQTETGKDSDGKLIDQKELESTKQYVESRIEVYNQFKQIKLTPPNTDITNEMKIDLGDRKVEIKFLGKGNTEGDIVVYLPEEKIIAAGDLVVSPVPYGFGSHPSEWEKTLRKIYDMDVDIIIPGHGRVLKDKTYLQKIIEVINLVVESTKQEIIKYGHTSGIPQTQTTIENIQNAIDWTEFRKYFSQGIKENEDFFDNSIRGGLVRAAVHEAEGK